MTSNPMRKVLKYQFTGGPVMDIPGGNILHTGEQGGTPTVWVEQWEGDSDQGVTFRLRLHPTGPAVIGPDETHAGTVVFQNGLVGHIYYEIVHND